MAYIVSANMISNINLSPSSVVEEVIQNVAVVLSTPKFSVPLNRGFGMPYEFIDKPIQVAQSILVSEVIEALEKSEPRAKVISVSFVEAELMQFGKLIPQVEVKILE